MKIPDELKRRDEQLRRRTGWPWKWKGRVRQYPEEEGPAGYGMPAMTAPPPTVDLWQRHHHMRLNLSLLPGGLLNKLRVLCARLAGRKGHWTIVGKVGVSYSLPCSVPRCLQEGVWDIATGWLCEKHRDLGPRVLTEIQKAWPSVGVNGPGIWVRLPQEKDVEKTAWLQLMFSNFGLVELPGWIG